jgi:hypothetical protein
MQTGHVEKEVTPKRPGSHSFINQGENMKKLITTALITIACVSVQAQESNWRIFAGVGYADGGDTIASGTIINVDTKSLLPFQIKAGTGFQQRIGAEYRLSPQFTIQGSVGHSANSPMGYNGSYDFTVVPIEIMGFIETGYGFRVGAGIRQANAELRGTGVVANDPFNGTYTGNQGSVVEIQYLFQNGQSRSNKSVPQFGLSLRGVNETFSGPFGNLNDNHYEIGVVLYY